MHRHLVTWTAVASFLLPAAAARAQTSPAVVHAFTIEPAFPGPVGELLQASDGTIYGTASWIGPSRDGAIYALRKQADGSWKRTLLHAFNGAIEGVLPIGGLIQARDGTIYGTTRTSGLGGGYGGTIFKLTAAGELKTLFKFPEADAYPLGTGPVGRLVEASDGNFYGVTPSGDGATTYGTIFKMTPDGVVSLIHVFDGFQGGSRPAAGLIQGADGSLYGTTEYGGSSFDRSGLGTVFRVTLAGDFTVLHRFGPFGGGHPRGALLQASNGLFYGAAARVFTITADGEFAVLAPELRDASGTLIEASDGALYGTQYGQEEVIGGSLFRMTKTGESIILHEFLFPGGTKPNAGVIEGQDGLLYGTTTLGGRWSGPPTNCFCGGDEFPAAWGSGTVFQIAKTGGLTTVMEFDATAGLVPVAPLLRANDGTFYGTTYAGGTTVDVPGGRGTVFAMTADGAVRTLHSFSNDSPFYLDVDESFHPTAGLVQGSDGALYGTTARTIFRVTPDNLFTQLHDFAELTGTISGLLAASDGALYGTTSHGGAFGFGTVFRITTTGEFTVLQSFSGSNGARPYASLVEAGGALYGTTASGGAYGLGTIFRLASSGLAVLHSFNFLTGAAPVAALIRGVDGQLYGTTPLGGLSGFGSGGSGTLFRMTLSGTVTLLHSFSGASGVATPLGRLLQAADGALYGTTYSGAVFGIAATGAGFRRVATLGVPLFAGLAEGPGGTLYGTAATGGPDGYGFVFRIVP